MRPSICLRFKVARDSSSPPLLGDDELVEIFEKAGAGVQLGIAGYVDRHLALSVGALGAVTLVGRFQFGIVDYVWGSGHTVNYDGALTLTFPQT